MKRDFVCVERGGYKDKVYKERGVYKETKEVYTRRPARYLCLINSSALRRQICQKRPVHVKRDLFMWKETCKCGKGSVKGVPLAICIIKS